MQSNVAICRDNRRGDGIFFWLGVTCFVIYIVAGSMTVLPFIRLSIISLQLSLSLLLHFGILQGESSDFTFSLQPFLFSLSFLHCLHTQQCPTPNHLTSQVMSALDAIQRLLMYCDNCNEYEDQMKCDNLTHGGMTQSCTKCENEGRDCESFSLKRLAELRTTLWQSLIPVEARDLFVQVINRHMKNNIPLTSAAIAFAIGHNYPNILTTGSNNKQEYILYNCMVCIADHTDTWQLDADNCAAYYVFYLLFSATMVHQATLSPNSKIESITHAMTAIQAVWSFITPFSQELSEHPLMSGLLPPRAVPSSDDLSVIVGYQHLLPYINALPANEWGASTSRVKSRCVSWATNLYRCLWRINNGTTGHCDRLVLLWPATKTPMDHHVWVLITNPTHTVWKILLSHWAFVCHRVYVEHGSWWLQNVASFIAEEVMEEYDNNNWKDDMHLALASRAAKTIVTPTLPRE